MRPPACWGNCILIPKRGPNFCILAANKPQAVTGYASYREQTVRDIGSYRYFHPVGPKIKTAPCSAGRRAENTGFGGNFHRTILFFTGRVMTIPV